MKVYTLHMKFQTEQYVSHCSPERDFYLYLTAECISATMLGHEDCIKGDLLEYNFHSGAAFAFDLMARNLALVHNVMS